MRILIYSLNFSPELIGIGKYSGELAKWLVLRGHEVRALTAHPYYPDWKVKKPYAGGQYSREFMIDEKGRHNGKLLIYRCPLWVPEQPTGFKRLLHLASFSLSSLPLLARCLFWRPEVIWVVAPALLCAPSAWLAARLVGSRCWLHIQDFEVDVAFKLGLLRGSLMRSLALGFERWLLRRFDRVSSISEKMVERLNDKGVLKTKSVMFPNWVDIKRGGISDGKSIVFRKQLGISGRAIVALYSGNMGNKQGLEVLSDAAVRLKDVKEIVFVFCGNGSGREELEINCAGLQNVHFLELQKEENFEALLDMADIHLLPQRADAADLVMPSKLNGMLASGKPVIAMAAPGTQVAKIVEKFGVVVAPDKPDLFVKAILDLASDSKRQKYLGEEGRRYAEKYLERQLVLERFESELTKLVGDEV